MYPDRSSRPQRQDVYTSPRPAQQPMQPQTQPRPKQLDQQPYLSDAPHYQPHGRNVWLKSLLIVLSLALIAGAGYGGYYYATNIKPKQNSNQPATSQQATQTSDPSLLTNPDASSINDPIHFVSSAGAPSDLGGKKTFAVSLGLPSIAQGIRTESYNNDRGQEQYYTDRFSNEIARWDIGYPDIAQPSQSQVSLLAISKSWLALKQNGNHAFDDTSTKLDTPAQKAAYVSKINNESQACVKDKAKGFSTKDSVFNVCFSLIPGVDTYTPVLVLRGYAEKEGQQLLLVGFVHLRDGQNYDKKTSEQLLADTKNGKLPDTTVKLIDNFVSAFSQTTFKVQ